ncbi:MAG: DUF2065 domain-containing protein [Alphaproteobacteria bacterium]|nr:DUF2065 domain-containing protein [Alphaproteobacteria bacterium]
MLTFSILTLTLAKAYGLYMLVTGLSGIVAPGRWNAMVVDFQDSPGLTYLTAVITFVLGLVLVGIHSFWTDPLAVVISLIGWIVLIEGLLLFAVPQGFLRLGASLVGTAGRARAYAVFAVILGVVLLVLGVMGRADASV